MSAAHVDLYRSGHGTPVYVRVDLMDVRAANTLLVHYDFDRDGWVLQCPTKMLWEDGEDSFDERLEEVGFVPAWTAAGEAELERVNGH